MSTSSLPSLTTSLNYILPSLTLLLGTGGLAGGLLTINNPPQGSKLFGVPLSPNTASPTVATAYIRTLGARNALSGLSLLTLTGLYGLAKFQSDVPVAAVAVKRCIGVVLAWGMCVGLSDSWVIGQYIDEAGIDEEEVREKAAGHMWVAPVVGLLGLGWLVF